MTQRIPYNHVRIGNVMIAEGSNGKVWLIASEDLPGEYRGEGLEPDDEAMRELSGMLGRFFLKNIAEAKWPASGALKK